MVSGQDSGSDDGESYRPLARTASSASDDRPSYQALDPVSGFVISFFLCGCLDIDCVFVSGQGSDSEEESRRGVNRTLSPCYGVGASRTLSGAAPVGRTLSGAAPVGRTLSGAAPVGRTGSWSPTLTPLTIIIGNRMAPRPIVVPGTAVKPGFTLVEDTVESGSGAINATVFASGSGLGSGSGSGSGAAAGSGSGAAAAGAGSGAAAGAGLTTPPATPVRLSAAGAVPPNHGRMLRDAKRPRTASFPPPVVLNPAAKPRRPDSPMPLVDTPAEDLFHKGISSVVARPPPVVIDLACDEAMPPKP